MPDISQGPDAGPDQQQENPFAQFTQFAQVDIAYTIGPPLVSIANPLLRVNSGQVAALHFLVTAINQMTGSSAANILSGTAVSLALSVSGAPAPTDPSWQGGDWLIRTIAPDDGTSGLYAQLTLPGGLPYGSYYCYVQINGVFAGQAQGILSTL